MKNSREGLPLSVKTAKQMTMLTLKLKSDILDLLEVAQRIYAQRGETLADSKASTLCFGHREWVSNLRKWDGGPRGPTMEKVEQFERFLRETVGEKAYAKFLKERKRPAMSSTGPADDFDD